VATYAVVVFSIAVQGLTVPRLVRRVLETGPPRDMDPLDATPT
jgi:NhaP-type Na+/H+ or K+/H+ antiporter